MVELEPLEHKEVEKKEPKGPTWKDKAAWGLAIAGVAGGAAAIYFRNQIKDGIDRLMGRATAGEKQEAVIRKNAIEAPFEFFGAAKGEPEGVPDNQFDSIHTPADADQQVLLAMLSREAEDEANHSKDKNKKVT